MLVLRKEIKIGIGAGLTILGIAGVYGLMASISSSNDHKDQVADVSTTELTDRQKALAGATEGLPPKVDAVDPATPTKTNDLVASGTDPFSESHRKDGNTSDVWSSALTTGKITGDVKKTSADSSTTVVKAPTKGDSKLVKLTPPTDGGVIVDPLPVSEQVKTSKGKSSEKTPETAVATAGGSKYTIKSGDTMSTIAEKFYGSRKFFNVLVKANPDINPSKMKVGHEITVPPKEAVATIGGAISEDVKLSTPIDASHQYRIAPGDTLSHISQKLYGKSTMWQAIYEANKTAIGPNEAKLKVGTLLELPQKPVR